MGGFSVDNQPFRVSITYSLATVLIRIIDSLGHKYFDLLYEHPLTGIRWTLGSWPELWFLYI